MQVEASSNDQNSFARRKAKFNPNVLVKLSSPPEMMKKQKEEESRFVKEKAPKSGSRSQKGIGTLLQKGNKNKKRFKRRTQKKPKGRRENTSGMRMTVHTNTPQEERKCVYVRTHTHVTYK